MLLILLIVILSFICIVGYRYNNKEICSPLLLYTGPFIPTCIIAWIYRDEWYFTLHTNTFFVIISGCLSFFIGSMGAKKVRIKYRESPNIIGINDKNIEFWKYYLFIVGQVACYVWKLHYIRNYGRSRGANTIAEAINYYNNALKFTTDALIAWPKILSLGLSFCTAAGFIWACILAQKIVQKKWHRKNLILVSINFFICLIGSMTSGGRGGAIQLIIAFICVYLIMYSRAHNWNVKLPFNIILKILIIIILTGYGFLAVMDFLGRQEINLINKYIANYIGAEIYNLDYFLNVSFRRSDIWGQETFQPIIQYVAGKLGISEWSRYNLDLPSVYINSATMGYISLGNVCTTFYAYIHDFGYIGTIILPMISGFISQLSYEFARNSCGHRVVNMGLFIYSNFAYALVFSFFSNKFYELIFTPNMVRKIICGYIIMCFLYKIRIKKRGENIKNNKLYKV